MDRPKEQSIIYENDRIIICLASFPITKCHTIVFWKDNVCDINKLNIEEYEYLMYVVDIVRNILIEILGIEKVYLLYMDEMKHVHWHLIPRYNEQGFNVFSHNPIEINEFSMAPILKTRLQNVTLDRLDNTKI